MEPLITSRGEVEQILAQQLIDYEVGMLAVEGDSFTWQIRDVNPILDRDRQIEVMLEFSGDVVARVFLLSVNICASDIISAYGIPPNVSQSDGPGDTSYIELYYPGEGLAFFTNSEGAPYFGTVYITYTDFVNYFANTGNSVDWNVIKDYFSVECSETRPKK
jgi:hypothetical protein